MCVQSHFVMTTHMRVELQVYLPVDMRLKLPMKRLSSMCVGMVVSTHGEAFESVFVLMFAFLLVLLCVLVK